MDPIGLGHKLKPSHVIIIKILNTENIEGFLSYIIAVIMLGELFSKDNETVLL